MPRIQITVTDDQMDQLKRAGDEVGLRPNQLCKFAGLRYARGVLNTSSHSPGDEVTTDKVREAIERGGAIMLTDQWTKEAKTWVQAEHKAGRVRKIKENIGTKKKPNIITRFAKAEGK